MSETEIYGLLLIRGFSGAKIAEKLEVTTSYVCQVVRGEKEGPRVREAIAEVLGLPIGEIWRKG